MKTKRTNITAFVLAMMGYLALLAGCASQPGSKPEEDQATATRLAAIQSITASETKDGVIVDITADGPVTFSSLKQPDPLAVVLYLPETTVDQVQPPPAGAVGPVQGIKVTNGTAGHTARIEIGLSGDVPYTAVRKDNAVQLTFASVAGPGAPESDIVVSEAKAGAAALGKSGWVNKVDFLNEPDGRSTLVIGTSHHVDYTILKSGPERLDIRLANTRIPTYRQRPLITTRFNSAVDRVTPVAPAGGRGDSVIQVELREEVPYTAEQSENILLVHFQPSTMPPKPLEQVQPAGLLPGLTAAGLHDAGVGAASVAGVESDLLPVADAAGSHASEYEDSEVSSLLGSHRKNYTGEKIALDFYETEIKNVFRIIREVSGKNFAIDKDVVGKVTMTLDNPVPWDQVLDLVLRMNQLGMVQEGEIIRIATLETLKVEDDLRKAKLEALRKSREEAKALEPLMTRYFAVSYSSADKEIKPHIEKILTKDRGTVSVDEKNNQIIVTDTAAKIRQAEEIVRRIDKVTSQVVIEAKVVEVSDEFSRELGIAWGMAFGSSGGRYNFGSDVAINFPAPGADSSIGINFARISQSFVLDARLNALEATGKGKILSSPKILTLDNKKARIKQGVEYAYLERDSSGGSSVKFKDIDLLLEVTPHVTPDNRISMSILLTKNDVASLTQEGVPSVATNEAETELLVNDGDTVVIGGIIKRAENKSENGLPLLKDIPVLGYAFKNNVKKINSNELLIFIMPRIVQLEQTTVAQR